jgi:ABC-2 type transport system permease protein
MTTATTAGSPQTPTGRVLALASTEVRLLLRNKTVAVSSILVPLALGAFWMFSMPTDGEPRMQAVVVSLQLAVVLGMGIYVSATQTVVARRHARVLKRLRTSSISDTGLLAGTLAPVVLMGIGQLVVFALIDVFFGSILPVRPAWLLLAVLGGIALALTAALATTVLTPSPERAQITTLPLTFVLLGAAIAVPVLPSDGWWQALIVIPGAAVGALVRTAFTGEMWGSDLFGIPAVILPVLALGVWPQVFATFAGRRFRWDPRR